MASIAPIGDALSAPVSTVPANPGAATTTATQAAAQAARTAAANAAQAAQSAPAATTQPIDFVFDSLALDSAFDDTLFTTPDTEASGAYSVFMGELFAALAAQQTETAQATAQANAPAQANAAAATTTTPNSALESDVQALAIQVQAATGAVNGSTATTTSSSSAATAAAGTLSPLQQSFEQFIATAGATAATASLPTFLQTLANNLHTVPSPLGNLIDSTT